MFPSRCPSLLLLLPSLTPDRPGGLDEFPSGSDPKWGGRTVTVPKGSGSHKFRGVKLPGGCWTSTSGGSWWPGAAGDPRQDLPSPHGKELGTVIPHSAPCILHPDPCIPYPDPCIPCLRSLHPSSRIPASRSLHPLSLHSESLYPSPFILDPCIPTSASHVLHPRSLHLSSCTTSPCIPVPALPGRCSLCLRDCRLCSQGQKKVQSGILQRGLLMGAGEQKVWGGLMAVMLWRGGRVQGDPSTLQMDGGREALRGWLAQSKASVSRCCSEVSAPREAGFGSEGKISCCPLPFLKLWWKVPNQQLVELCWYPADLLDLMLGESWGALKKWERLCFFRGVSTAGTWLTPES